MSLELTSYLLGKKAGGGGTINNQNKTITENGSYTADAGYTGLGVVTVDVETPAPNLQNKNVTITENTTTNISADSGYDGLGQVSVTTNVPTGGGSIDWSEIGYSGEPQAIQDGFDYAKDIYDDWDSTQTNLQGKFTNDLNLIYMPLVNTSNAIQFNTMFRSASNLEYMPLINTSNGTAFNAMFESCSSLKTIPQLDISKSSGNINRMFAGCSSLKTISQLNTSNVTNVGSMFEGCSSLTTIPQLDTSNVTNMDSMFRNCINLTTIPQLNTENVTNMGGMFYQCRELLTIPQLNTSNVTNVGNMFYYCSKINNIPELDFKSVTSISAILDYINNGGLLTNLGGFKDLGQAYLTTQSANNYSYRLSLQYCTNLTHDSLMNVINKLYDIATKGCNVQQLVLGSTNLAKLTAEEIAIATNKGFSVS